MLGSSYKLKVAVTKKKKIANKVEKGARHQHSILITVIHLLHNNFLHPENLLLAMIADSRKEVRQLACKYICQARILEASTSLPLRKFHTPKINFKAKDYCELIDWDIIKLSVPPLLRDLSDQDVIQIIEEPLKSNILKEIKSYPCHTQAVERAVKLVTETSMLVTNAKKRDGVIFTTLYSRSKMPKFDTKKNVVV